MEANSGSGRNDPAVAGRGPSIGADAEHAARWDRITAVAGLLFIVLVVASFFTPETPEYGSTADELAAGLTDERAGHQMSLLLGFLADIAFLVFLAGVWSRFRRHEGSGGMMSGLFAIAGAAFVATIVISEGIYLALVQAAESADPSTLPTIAALDYWVGLGTVPVAVALAIGATGAILSTHALPAWLGYLSGVNAVVLVLGLGGVFESEDETWLVAIGGFGGFLLLLIWVLATSVVLLTRSGTRADAMA